MMPPFGPRGRSSLLPQLLAAGLLSACTSGAPQAPAPAAETAAASQAPGTISAHLNGRESFFMGVGSSN